MNRLKFLAFLTLLLSALIATSCSDHKSFAQMQDDEIADINAYISRNKIKVITELPKAGNWKSDTYFKSSSGLYFNLLEMGDSTEQLKPKSKVSVRFILSKIDKDNSLIIRNWEGMDFIYPEVVHYKDIASNSNFGVGVHEALGYMKNLNSVANILVPSELNTSKYANSVTPVVYKIKITSIK